MALRSVKPAQAIKFRQAVTTDDPQLLEILEESDFKGDISLLYTRRPSPTASLARDGEHVEIVVCEKQDEQKLVAMFACTFNPLYINGKPETTGYIGSLRIRKKNRSAIVHLPGAFKALFAAHKAVKYFYSSILASNHAARRILEKERPGLPRVHFLGSYGVYALKTGGRSKQTRGCHFHQCLLDDIPALLAFYEAEAVHRPFFPVLTRQALMEGKRNPHYSAFYLLTAETGEILAAGAAWDQRDYKQYIVQGYNRKYGILFFVLNLLAFLGFPRIEQPGKVMNFYTLSFLAVKKGNIGYFKLFLAKLKAATNHYSYLIAGFYRDDPLKKVCSRLPHYLYKSNIFLVHAGAAGGQYPLFTTGNKIPYFECGRL